LNFEKKNDIKIYFKKQKDKSMIFNKKDTLYYYYNENEKYNESIGFDLDHTLICPKSNKKLPINYEDFEIKIMSKRF
jgi:hypothetical protein